MSDIEVLKILGIGLINVPTSDSAFSFEILYKKGISTSLVQNILELYKKDILEKKKGNSIFPLEEYSVFISYSRDDKNNSLVLIYLDIRESALTYSQLYKNSFKTMRSYLKGVSMDEIISICKSSVEIPKATGIQAIFVVDRGGCPLLSMVSEERQDLANIDVQIGGFISALFSLAPFVLEEQSGAKLKEINFDTFLSTPGCRSSSHVSRYGNRILLPVTIISPLCNHKPRGSILKTMIRS